jgi:hypothetical protein
MVDITVPKIMGEFFKARPNQQMSNHFSQIAQTFTASQELRQVIMTKHLLDVLKASGYFGSDFVVKSNNKFGRIVRSITFLTANPPPSPLNSTCSMCTATSYYFVAGYLASFIFRPDKGIGDLILYGWLARCCADDVKFEGAIDNVRIHIKVLSASQIQVLYDERAKKNLLPNKKALDFLPGFNIRGRIRTCDPRVMGPFKAQIISFCQASI